MKIIPVYLRNYLKPFIWALLFVSGEAVCDLLSPSIMAKIIDVGVKNMDSAYILRSGGLLLLAILAGAFFANMRNILSSRVGMGIGADLRLDMFRKINVMPVANVDQLTSGALITRLTNDVTQVQNFVTGLSRVFLKAPVTLIGAVVMASLLNVRLTPMLLAVVLLVSVLVAWIMSVAYPMFARVQAALDRLNTVTGEYLSGIRLVKAFGSFAQERRRFAGANETLSDQSIFANRTLAILGPCMSVVVNLAVAGMIWLGARYVDSGTMQVGQIMAFINYMAQLLVSLTMISNILNVFVRTKTSAERIRQVMDVPNEPRAGEKPDEALSGELVFEDVTFRYPGAEGAPALSHLSFTLPAGKTLGIIGPTGSGKSTLISLLMRFYQPDEGRILLGGEPISALSPEFLRENVSLAPQNPGLFSGSVGDNIRWGDTQATEEEVRWAAELSCAQDFISEMPKGYEEMLGQGGVNLSGGQKQRISLARALIRKARVLMLDDCTGALDAVTEARVLSGLREYCKGVTTLLVSQRIGTVRSCDAILVLDDGVMKGFGTHQELMEHCDLYRDIYDSQFGKEERA